ncbi:hypothetical protein ACFCVS_17120 [Bacillus altitudinis]|uniref:hypothetical protein n=1 Tax=Bacillus altitudinis TaxID=293387 RepID=UPI0035DB8F1C
MYNIGYMLVCDDIVNSETNSPVIINPKNLIDVGNPSSRSSLLLVASLIIDLKDQINPLPDATLRIKISDPVGNVIHETSDEKFNQPTLNERHIDKYNFATATITAKFENVEFKIKGLHKIELFINQVKKKELLLPVFTRYESIEVDQNGEF